MTVQERKDRQKQALRDAILDAARELFANEGYEAVTMRKVAEKIDYSPTAIYLHFRDKETLIRELCDHDFLIFAGEFQKIARIKDPVERLRRAGHAYIDFGVQHPQQYRLMFMTPTPPMKADDSSIRKGDPAEDAYAFVAHTVGEGVAAGRYRSRDIDLIAQTVWAGVHGVISLDIAKHCDDWVAWKPMAKRARLMVDVLIDGLTKE